VRLSGKSATFDISKTNAPPTEAFLEYAVLFLEILDHV